MYELIYMNICIWMDIYELKYSAAIFILQILNNEIFKEYRF